MAVGPRIVELGSLRTAIKTVWLSGGSLATGSLGQRSGGEAAPKMGVYVT